MRTICILTFLYILTGCGTTMSKYESPNYQEVLKEGEFELRSYAPALIASTAHSSENSGFRKIFRFISGDNSGQDKISMTVPVRMSVDDNKPSMAFFMPSKYSAETIPQPNNNEVKVGEFSGGQFAAHRFTGTSDESKVEQKIERLVKWATEKGYTATDERYLDRYDPPWTFWFMKTNEILVRVE
ncbi:heme-binding protein [Oligoflexia bacterium]|nr:heme-binding protein [Oligoflexia bacterium]